jgi:NAD(P)-dependent dehydrogenase (short-subunit alcohol dehydrogenase family)
VASLRTKFPPVTFLFKKCDISNWDEQKAVFDEVYNEFGGIDIVFANAGISEAGKFLEMEDGEPTKPNLKTLSVNLEGTLYCECHFWLLVLKLTDKSCKISYSLYEEEDYSI